MANTNESAPGRAASEPEAIPVAPAKKRGLSPRVRGILVGAGSMALIAGISGFAHHQLRGRYYQSSNNATVQADAVIISSRVSGYVADVLVGDNQDVVPGQPLVRLEGRDYRAQTAQADAQIAQAQAAAASAQASVGVQRAMIERARADLAIGQAKAAHDKAEVARYRPLTAAGAESQLDLSRLEIAATESAQQVRALTAALAAQERTIGTIDATMLQARAQRAAGTAQRVLSEVNVGATELKAPVAGRVGNRTVTTGQFVQAGTRLMTVVPLDKLYVVANFKETQVALMRRGQPVTIKIDALDGLEIAGLVDSIAPGTGSQFSLLPPQNATGNFTKIVQRVPVRILLNGSAARRVLVPGLSVEVTVNTISAKAELELLRAKQPKGIN